MPKTSIVTVAIAVLAGGMSLVAAAGGIFQGSSGDPGLVAAEVLAQTATPSAQVTGDPIDCPPAGVGPEDTQAIHESDAGTFRVIGTLSSFDGVNAVVAGPSGDVSASLAPDFELVGDLSAGTAVEMNGISTSGGLFAEDLRSACDGVGVIDCQVGADPRFMLTISAGSFKLTGVLDSLSGDTVKVLGPGLLVEASVDTSTVVETGIQPGDPVTVKGSVLSETALKALEIQTICAEGPATPSPSPSPSPTTQPESTPAAEVCEGDEDDAGQVSAENSGLEIQRGRVISAVDGTLMVETGVGPLSVSFDEDDDRHGDLQRALEVDVSGELQEDGSVVADEVEVVCQLQSESADCNEEDENRGHGNDCDHDDEDNPGRGEGNNGNKDREKDDDGDDEGGGEDED